MGVNTYGRQLVIQRFDLDRVPMRNYGAAKDEAYEICEHWEQRQRYEDAIREAVKARGMTLDGFFRSDAMMYNKGCDGYLDCMLLCSSDWERGGYMDVIAQVALRLDTLEVTEFTVFRKEA